MDSAPLFAAILDPATGGCFTLEPTVPYTVSRRYLPGTNVLETTFETRDGSVTVVDSINRGPSGELPWSELARDVRAVRDEVPMRWRVAPGSGFQSRRPWTRYRDVPLLRVGEVLIALVAERAGAPHPDPRSFHAEFVARQGSDALLALIAAEAGPLVVPSAGDIRRRREATESSWQSWSQDVPYQGRDRELQGTLTCSRRWETTSATYGPSRTAASGNSPDHDITRSPKPAAGSRLTGWYGWPTAVRCRDATPTAGRPRRP